MDWNDNMVPVSNIALVLLTAGLVLAAGAENRDVGALRREYRQLQERHTALNEQRDAVVGAANRLSARIDSLKASETDPESLHEELRASLVLVQRIVDIDNQLDTLQRQQDDVREKLRLAYDWEIGQLIQRIEAQPDEGLLAQLMVYQQERETLGTRPSAAEEELRYGGDMAINPGDGPDEIRQKMELMEDIAVRLRAEARATSKKLSRLEEEHRLRSRVSVFVDEIRLFDEHLSPGRVLVHGRDGSVSDRQGGESRPIDSPELSGSTGVGVVRGSRQVDRGGEIRRFDSGSSDIMLEIHKLRARQQEIRELEAVARDRAASFRAYLNEMLEGGG